MSEVQPGHGPSRELVTGATGLVGMYRLAWRLERGWPTVALRRSRSNVDRVADFLKGRLGVEFDAAWAALEWREADLSDVVGLEEAMEGCGRVFHAAGRVSFQPGDEVKLKAVNATGTAHVVDAALGAGVTRLVHVSSVAALGRSDTGEPVHELSDWAEGVGASPYGKSKREGEFEAWRGAAEGLDVFVVNPTIILGDARYDESSGMVYRSAAKGRRYHPAGGNGFVGAEDLLAVIGALDALADEGKEGILGEGFVVSAEDVTYRNVMTWVAESLGTVAPVRPLKGWMLEVAWRAAAVWSMLSRKPAILTRDMARNTRNDHRYDTSKLKATLPDFTFTPIEEVIRKETTNGLDN